MEQRAMRRSTRKWGCGGNESLAKLVGSWARSCAYCFSSSFRLPFIGSCTHGPMHRLTSLRSSLHSWPTAVTSSCCVRTMLSIDCGRRRSSQPRTGSVYTSSEKRYERHVWHWLVVSLSCIRGEATRSQHEQLHERARSRPEHCGPQDDQSRRSTHNVRNIGGMRFASGVRYRGFHG